MYLFLIHMISFLSLKRFLCPFRLNPEYIDRIRYEQETKIAIGYKYYCLTRSPTLRYLYFLLKHK